MLLLNPPRDAEQLKTFIEGLAKEGARLNGSTLIEPYCNSEWCLLIITSQQARDSEIPCTWPTSLGNCIIYATKQAVELFGLTHVPDELVPIAKDAPVPRVSVPGHRLRLLGNATLSEVGFTRVNECRRYFGDQCLKRVSAEFNARENAVLVTVESTTAEGGVYSDVVAKLPRRMAVVRDPYLDYDEFLVAWGEDGRIITINTANDVEGFLNAIDKRAGNRYFVWDVKYAKLIKNGIKTITKPISAGLGDGDLIDPYGVLDTTNYGINWLIKVYNWLGKYYGANQRVAWLNVVFTMAKVITPRIRIENRQFVDHVVWNRGRGAEGKTTLVNIALARMLQAHEAPYLVVMSGPVTSIPQARTLIAVNRLPLILDEQFESLADYAQMLHVAAVGYGTVSIHAPKYGLDEPVRFHNLRGVIVFTNVSFREFYRRVLLKAGGDRAVQRRFIELTWFDEILPKDAFADLPEVKPVYGLILDVVRRHWDYLREASDLVNLSIRLMEVLGSDYPVFKPIADTTTKWLLDLVREKEDEVKGSAEELRLSDYAKPYCGGRVSVFCELRALLERGERDGEVSFSGGRDNVDEVRGRIDEVLGKYFGEGVRLSDIVNGTVTVKISDDALEALRMLNAKLNSGLTRVHFKPRSLIVPGFPRSVLGVTQTKCMSGGVEYRCYPVRLDALLAWLLGQSQG